MRRGYSFDDVLLVPKHGILSKRAEADISSDLVDGFKLETPIISANMPSVTGSWMAKEMWKAGGIGALHRIDKTINEARSEYQQAVLGWHDVNGYGEAIVSLGLHDGLERAIELNKFGAYLFLLDVAHGDHVQVVDFINNFRNVFGDSCVLIVGNIATANALHEFPLEKIDAVKVGIGPGAACRTREVTGFGVPQLTAILDVAEELRFLKRALYLKRDIKLIADGGIKNSGDIVKAFAAGADTVMIGRLLAGCVEAPEGLVYYGNASPQVNGHRAPEGSSGPIEASGTVADVIKELSWGIRSGISYGGATNVKELRQNAEFIEVSPLTHIESSVRI